jgi:glycosyltransferase involved in cell wall biosynthesis
MSDKNPTLSVGMPIYNGETYIEHALNSILSQSFTDFELIISDNGSTDRSMEICREFAARDARISIHLSPENRGAAWNYNRVFELARGKYFKWFSHDDQCSSNLFEVCIDVLDRNEDVVICYGKTVLMDEDGLQYDQYHDGLHLRQSSPAERFRIFHWRMRTPPRLCNAIMGVVRAEALARTPRIGNYIASDMILLGELCLSGQFHEVQEASFLRREHAGRSTRAHHDHNARAEWFDPANKDKIQRPNARCFLEYLRAVHRVPMGLKDSLLSYAMVLRWLVWNWRVIIWEVVRGY